MHLAQTLLVYSKDTPEHDRWKNAVQTPETRIFAVIPTEHDEDGVRGSIVELNFSDQQRDIIQNSIGNDFVLQNPNSHLRNIRSQWENKIPGVQQISISSREFLVDINTNYMAQLAPESYLLRIAPEAAKELLARDDVCVSSLRPEADAEPLSPLDAVKSKKMHDSPMHGFVIDKLNIHKIDAWAKRNVEGIARRVERDEHKKTKQKSEEL